MPINIVSPSTTKPKNVRVETLEGGTLVRYSDTIYIVLLYDNNASRIGAVSLYDGGYLSPETLVEVIPAGDVLTITVGE